MPRNRLWAVASAGAVLAGCGGAPAGNPLIGAWSLAGGDCPTTSMTFTPTNMTTVTEAIGPYPSETDTVAVTYNTTDPKKIYVLASAGETNAFFYQVRDDGKIVLNGDHCVYQRRG